MRGTYTQLYVHLVWATWDRLPLVTPVLEPEIYAVLIAKCKALKGSAIAVGGIMDHVHVLTRFHTTVAIADLVHDLKGSSSHCVTHELQPGRFFKWQGSYGAFTVSKADVPRVKAYVLDQKKHHAQQTLWHEWEICQWLEDDIDSDRPAQASSA